MNAIAFVFVKQLETDRRAHLSSDVLVWKMKETQRVQEGSDARCETVHFDKVRIRC